MDTTSIETPLERAIRIAGGGAALARLVRVSPVMVHKWRGGSRITAERARDIEVATQGAVQRHELRPDIFDPPATAAPVSVEEGVA